MSPDLLIATITLGLLIGLLSRLYVFRKYNRANKIALLVAKENYEKAIEVGEKIPINKMSNLEKINLCAAYHHVGRINDAKKVINSKNIEKRTPALIKTLTKSWKEKVERSNC